MPLWASIIIIAVVLLLTILLLSSCATGRYTIADATDSTAITDANRVHLERVVQTLQVLDSVFVHDSVIERYYYGVPDAIRKDCGGESGDTGCFKGSAGALPCNPVVERAEWHTRYKYRDRVVHDTLCTTDTVVQVKTQTITKTRTITQPPERYIPKFYKWCTWLFVGLIVLLVIYIVLRFALPL